MAIRNENHEDLSLFKNRLWKLMEKNYKAPKELATVLYDKGLIHVRSRSPESTPKEDIRKNAIGSIEKIIIKHLHSPSINTVSGEYIHAYCIHFSCSADYLFGHTDVTTLNHSIRNACETTGLTENSINTIIEITNKDDNSLWFGYNSENNRRILNSLLSSNRFINLFESIYDLDTGIKQFKSVSEKLRSELGEKLFSDAVQKYHSRIDYLSPDHPGEPLSKEQYEAIAKIDRAVIDEDMYNYLNKIARYELNESFENLIEDIYPRFHAQSSTSQTNL